MDFYIFLLSLSFVLLLCNDILLRLRNGQLFLTKKNKLPPGPTGLPVIGNLLELGNRPHESLSELAKKHGPLMTVRLGFNTTVVASSVEMAREILQKNDQAFLGRPIPHAVTAEKNYDLSMAWLPGNAKWRSLRKLCNGQVFTTQRLDALQGLRRQMVEHMVGRVMEASKNGEAISVGGLVFGTSLNLLSNTMLSVDIIDPKSELVIQELKELISKIMELAGKPNVSDYFPFLRRFDLLHIRRDVKVSYDRMHDLLDEIIDGRMKRRESGAPRLEDFLDVLLDHVQEHGIAEEFDREDINILLADLFIGGTDTTTTTIEWVMSELLANPHIMSKAKQELYQTTDSGTRMLEERDIPKLPYLQSLLKEAMRLHPTAPLLLPHRAETDVQVCGYTIPKHTQVFVNSWAIARDPLYWDKPLEFTPERFMGGEIDFRGTNFSFTPFGSGRRICPGLALAVRMLTLILGSLIHHFDWKLPDGMAPQDLDMSDKFGVTLQRATPLVAIPVIARRK